MTTTTTKTRKIVLLRIFLLLLLCTAIAALSFLPTKQAVAQEESMSIQAANASATRYKAVTEIEDGATIVFSAYIGTEGAQDANSKFINHEDRLLKTALYPSTTREDAVTETVIQKNGDYIDFNDTQGYSFLVEKAAGMTNDGNQGYYLKSLTGVASRFYLDVRQDIIYLEKDSASTANLTLGGKKFGAAWISRPFVCLSQDKTRVWYWNTSNNSFYTLFTSQANAFGIIRETDLETFSYYFINDSEGYFYMVNWIDEYVYAAKEDFAGTSYTFLGNNIGIPGADTKLTLIGSNPPPDQISYQTVLTMGQSMVNPYYHYTETSGETPTTKACLGLCYETWYEYIVGQAEKTDLTVYQKIENTTLTVEGGTGSGTYGYGQTVTINADDPDDSGHFSQWTIVSGNAEISSKNNNTTTVVLYDDAVTIKAQRTSHRVTAQSDCTQNAVCSACGYVVKEGESSHDFSSEYVQYEKTVTENGISVTREYHSHQCVNSCYGGKTCTVTEEAACSGGTATCTERAVCAVCGNEYGELAPHTPEVVAGKAATCTETGLTDGSKCSACGITLKEQEVIPALGHDYTDVTPEWSWEGLTSATASFECTRDGCGHVESYDAILTDEITTAATCEREGVRTYTATVRLNGKEFTDTQVETLEKVAHTPEVVAGKAATCTETGLTDGSKCSVCGITLKEQEVTPALGHDYTDVTPEWSWEGLTSATASFECTRDGCGHVESCDAVLTDEITTAATCEREGVQTYTATVRLNGKEFTDTQVETLEKVAHTPEVVAGKAATCTETGLTDGSKCSVCGITMEEQREIAPLGHIDADGDNLCDFCGFEMSRPQYTVKVEGGTIDGADGSTLVIEENASVTAIAEKSYAGKVFKGWSTDGGKTIVSTENVYTFAASADVTLTAVYEDMPDIPPEGLSGGAIAGIVIAIILGALAIAYGVCALLFKKKILKGTFFAKIYPFIK